jgi:hypothetical protein
METILFRVSCPKARQPWEDDFEKSDFFTKKFTKKQVRVQLSSNLSTPDAEILSVASSLGLCIVDSCSDVTLARRDVLSRLHLVPSPVVIAHLGGETILREAGSLQLGVPGEDASQVTLHDVLAEGIQDLPAGVVALIGVADVRRLGLSLYAILANPGCNWTDALPSRRPARGFAAEDLLEQSSLSEPSKKASRADAGFVPPTELEQQRFLGMRRDTLLELQARARQEQEERTATRIGRLFLLEVAHQAGVVQSCPSQ